LEVLNNYQRKKLDESNDEEFYSDPKFVYHLDANFRQNLSVLYETEIDNYSTVLDLMSSWDSYLPEDKKYKKVIGHGLNKQELEKNKMIPGFVEGIVKMKIGDTKTLNLKFPEDYSHEDSRGKEAIFEVNLKDLKEKELPELNDDFAKQSGNKDSLKELKKDLEKQLKDKF